jgi:hypothetical protein
VCHPAATKRAYLRRRPASQRRFVERVAQRFKLGPNRGNRIHHTPALSVFDETEKLICGGSLGGCLLPSNSLNSTFKAMLNEAKVFWTTRRAILQGEPLWDYDRTQTPEKFFGPWKFNAVQSGIAGGLAAAITNALDFLLPQAPTTSLLEVTLKWVNPFITPIWLTCLAFLMGWGSLKKEHSSPSERARARAAYLYLDGAYGFWPELLLASLIAFSRLNMLLMMISYSAYSAVFLSYIVVSIWQIYITLGKLPKLLFTANRYSVGHFWQPRKQDDPPWGRLVSVTLLVGLPLFFAVSEGAFAIAYGLAKLVSWVRHITG